MSSEHAEEFPEIRGVEADRRPITHHAYQELFTAGSPEWTLDPVFQDLRLGLR